MNHTLKTSLLKLRLLCDKYDKFLEDKKESERLMVMSLPALIVLFFAYIYIFPKVDVLLTKATNQKISLQQQISQSSTMLSSDQTNDALSSIKHEIESTKQKIEEITKEKNFIEDGIYTLSLQGERWEELLESISNEGGKHNISLALFEFENTKISQNITSTHIKISGKGGFLNLLKFLDSIEGKNRFIKIKELELKSGTEIDFKVLIEVWRVDV